MASKYGKWREMDRLEFDIFQLFDLLWMLQEAFKCQKCFRCEYTFKYWHFKDFEQV